MRPSRANCLERSADIRPAGRLGLLAGLLNGEMGLEMLSMLEESSTGTRGGSVEFGVDLLDFWEDLPSLGEDFLEFG